MAVIATILTMDKEWSNIRNKQLNDEGESLGFVKIQLIKKISIQIKFS